MKTKTRYLAPTVVPAQPGFRLAHLYVLGDGPVTPETTPNDVGASFDPVIAWLVRPSLEAPIGSADAFEDGDFGDASVLAVTPDGTHEGDNVFLVGPDEHWSRPYDQDFADGTEARQHWLDTKRRWQT